MPTDAVLLESYAATCDADAFAELVQRHAGMVFGVCRRICGNGSDAEDLTQNCFVMLARNAGRIRGSLPAWLHTVAIRSAAAFCHRQRARRHQPLDERMLESPSDEQQNSRSLLPRIDQALAQLPQELREILTLRYLQNHSQEAISRQMGLSQPTVSRRLQEGIGALRRLLGADAALILPMLKVDPPASLFGSLGKIGMAGVGLSGHAGSGAATFAGSILAWGILIGLVLVGAAAWILLSPSHIPLPTSSPADTPAPASVPVVVVRLSQEGIVADGMTDQRDRLQVIFDRAGAGTPLEIINDLGGILLTSGNDVWSNTTVRTEKGGTWRLAPGSSRGILRNRHPLASWPAGARRQDGGISAGPTLPDAAHLPSDTTHGDFNLSLIGGTYDGNRRSGGWPNDGRTPSVAKPILGHDDLMVCALQFHGVKHLRLQGVHVFDSPSLGMHISNVIDVVADDCDIACPAVIYGSNQDGFHLNGPAQDITVTNLHIRQTGDDAIAISSDDSMESSTEGNQALYFGVNTGWGPITHVRMRGVHLERCSSGLRPLSASQRIDDVIINDLDGTCLGACILFDKYLFNHDPGNIGHFTMNGVHLTTLGLTYDGAATGFTAPSAPPGEVFYSNTNIESLDLKQVTVSSTGGTTWFHMRPSAIQTLNLDHAEILDPGAKRSGVTLFQIDPGASCGTIRVHDIQWHDSQKQSGTMISNQGTIARLDAPDVHLPSAVQLVVGGVPASGSFDH